MRVPIVVGLALCSNACSTFTSCQSARFVGLRFSEKRIEDNRKEVSFPESSLTERERVENSLLYRAAELSLSNVFDHFVVAKANMLQ